MPFKSVIATTIGNILINVVSGDISNKKLDLAGKLDFLRFKRKNNKWIEEFCREHDGTVLTKGAFVEYVKYQKPIEKIFNYNLEPEKYNNGVQTFLNKQVMDTKEYLKNVGCVVSVQDETILKELYIIICDNLNDYFITRLSLKEKYLYTATLKSINNGKEELKEDNNRIDQGIKKILTTLNEKNQINDSEMIWNIYCTLSDEIWIGKLEDVHKILPLLKGKNEDLEYAIRIKLKIVSNYSCLTDGIIETWKQIRDTRISDDVARLIILSSIEEKEVLEQLREYVKNKELKVLVEHLFNKEWDKFLTVELKKENHINVMYYTLTDCFENERWVVKRISIYYLYKQSVFNVAEAMKTVLTGDMNFIDDVFITEKQQEQLLSTIEKNPEIKKEIFDEMKDSLKVKQWKYYHANEKIQLMFYRILLRATLITNSGEVDKEIDNCPEALKNNITIEAFAIQAKIERKEITQDEIIQFCLRTGQYWLLNNFLLQYRNNPIQIRDVLETCFTVLENDPALFIMYVQAVRITKGKKEAYEILKKYEEKYADYLEYWIEYEQIDFNATQLVENTFDMWETEQLKTINLHSEVDFIELLIRNKKYKEAYQIVKKIETLRLENSDILCIKAKILLEQGQVINALNILEKIFDDYAEDPFVVDTSIVLAINTKREIPNKVLEAAINIGTSRLLMLVAVVYERNKKNEEAFCYMTKALLKSDNCDTDVYGNYFGLHIKSDNDSVRDISCVDVDTAVYMVSEDNIERVYCIYKKNVLPTEPYVWEKATHIYLDTAITIGLLRKKNGDNVCIKEKEYTITEIMTVDCFLFRMCMKKLVERGALKQFTIPIMEDGNVDYDKFTNLIKEYTPSTEKNQKWLENYKDLTNIPIPFFKLEKFTRLNYEQLIMTFLEDESIIIRELMHPKEVLGEKFVLSVTALVMLYKIGINPHYLKENDVVITKSTYQEIQDETEDIIKTNNKEDVSSIGVIEDKLFLNVLTEEDKIAMMKEASGLKKFVGELQMEESNSDIEDDKLEQFNLIETFGICDYDAMVIARNSECILVTGEIASMYLIQMEDIKISGIGIIDFLTAIHVEIDDLLNYMIQMAKYRFLITITKSSLCYLLDCYAQVNDIEKQECYLEKWIDYLSIIDDMNEEYKTVFMQGLTDVFRNTYEKNVDTINPMWTNFVYFIMKYNNLKVEVHITEDGKLEVSTYKARDN